LLPWIGGRIVRAGGWIWQHPQPAVLVGLLAIAGWGIYTYAQRAEAFRVTDIRLEPNAALRIPPTLIGQNLWTVDVRGLAESLSRQQPTLKTVRVVRELPNRLRIEAVARQPIAQVRLDQWYPVDEEGYLLPDGWLKPSDELVRLVGVETPQARLRAGAANTSERLHVGLRVVETMRRQSWLQAHRLRAVDVSDPRQISFMLDEDVEIRCGAESELPAQLERLQAVLKSVEPQRVAIRYIDVRFAQPVVSPRT